MSKRAHVPARLLLATLLKMRRDLGCFPAPNTIHAGTVAHLAAQLGVAQPTAWPDEVRLTKSLYRYQAAVRTYLSVTPYDAAAEQMVAGTVLDAAETMSDPADLINFTSFIPCGVWEAVHILDGLLKNRSAVQPDTLHADTQGQSESVFGLCRLTGIKLMPRMRGLGGVTFYRPAKETRYGHIDALFTGDIDWDLIATHARDMIQVVLSIQAGRVMP